MSCPVEVGLGISDNQPLGTQHQQWCKLLVFVEDVGREPQFAQQSSLEDISPSGTLDVVVAQILAASHGFAVVVGEAVSLLLTHEVEQHHVGILVSDQVEAMLVLTAQQLVVAVQKLYVFAFSHSESSIACNAQPFVFLADADDVIKL